MNLQNLSNYFAVFDKKSLNLVKLIQTKIAKSLKAIVKLKLRLNIKLSGVLVN